MKDDLARKAEEAVKAREVQNRLDARPIESLSRVEQLERQIRDAKLNRDNGDAVAEFQAKIDKYCGGLAYESPVLGLTELQLLNCTVSYKRPETINTTTTAAGVTKQYVYRMASRTVFVYFTNGRISAVQD